jgi:hypothetical protein
VSRTVVFVGPTMKLAEARAMLDADFRPPAQRGDVLHAVADGAGVIGLIDGYTHLVPAVTHKEILFALSRGVRMYGAASLGALRAAELAPYGMVGVGRICESYRRGEITSDEVAISHGPMELAYCTVSEAMVNVRATIAAAVAAGLLRSSARALLGMARANHFATRTWAQLLTAARRQCLPEDEIRSFELWLPAGRVDQKRLDAIALLETIAQRRQHPPEDDTWPLDFRPTQAFSILHRRIGDGAHSRRLNE